MSPLSSCISSPPVWGKNKKERKNSFLEFPNLCLLFCFCSFPPLMFPTISLLSYYTLPCHIFFLLFQRLQLQPIWHQYNLQLWRHLPIFPSFHIILFPNFAELFGVLPLDINAVAYKSPTALFASSLLSIFLYAAFMSLTMGWLELILNVLLSPWTPNLKYLLGIQLSLTLSIIAGHQNLPETSTHMIRSSTVLRLVHCPLYLQVVALSSHWQHFTRA